MFFGYQGYRFFLQAELRKYEVKTIIECDNEVSPFQCKTTAILYHSKRAVGMKAVFLVGKVAEFTDSYHFWNIFCCVWKSKNVKSTPKTFKTEKTGLQKNFHKRKQNSTAFLRFRLPKIFIQRGS